MRIKNLVESYIIKPLPGPSGQIDWAKFVGDFRQATKSCDEPFEVKPYLDANEKVTDMLKAEDKELWVDLMSGLFDQTFGRSHAPVSETIWALPQTKQDVQFIMYLLKEGVLVEQAMSLMSNVMGSEELVHQAQIQSEYMPRSNFASTLANFILTLDPCTAAMKELQDGITLDPELSACVSVPCDESARKDFTKALHNDLSFLKESEERFRSEYTVLARAIEWDVSPTSLRNEYIKVFEGKSLVSLDTADRACFALNKALRGQSQLHESQQYLAHAALYQIDEAALTARYNEIYNNKIETGIISEAKVNKARRYKSDRNLIRQYEKQHQLASDPVELVSDLCETFAQPCKHYTKAYRECWEALNVFGQMLKLQEDVIPFKKKITPKVFGQAKVYQFGKMGQDNTPTEIETPKPKPIKSINAQKSDYDTTFAQYQDAILQHIDPDNIPQIVNITAINKYISKKYGAKLLDAGIMPSEMARAIEQILSNNHAKVLVAEDVIPFKRPNTASLPWQQGEVLSIDDYKKFQTQNDIVDEIKDLIDSRKSTLGSKKSRGMLANDIELMVNSAYGNEPGALPKVLLRFKNQTGTSVGDYMQRQASMSVMNEGVTSSTANKCRVSLCKLARKYTDSSNIAMLSNFESYENQDKISLKMAIYESSPKKLDAIREKLTEDLVQDGWRHKEGKFIKGTSKDGVMIHMLPVSKTFRSGAYKNRETPTLSIEILGSKRQQIDSNE